jgi:PAS domain S-box-containing protein
MQHRRHPRHPSRIAVALASQGRTASGQIIDLSCGGARVDTSAAWAPGSAVTLHLPPESLAAEPPLHGAVVWSRPQFLGLAWQTPLAFAITSLGHLTDAPVPEDDLPDAHPSPGRLRFHPAAPELEAARHLVPTEEGCLEDALALAANLTQVERGSILLRLQDHPVYHPWCDWRLASMEPAPCPDLQNFPWLAAALAQKQTVIWRCLDDLPVQAAADRAGMAGHGILARIALPLADSQSVYGALVLDSLRAPRAWPEDIAARLQTAARMLALSIDHARIRGSLRQTSQFWESLIDTFPHPAFFKDTNGRYRGCNAAFAQQVLGVPKSGVARHSFFDTAATVPYPLAKIYHQQDRVLLREGDPQAYEARVRCADGRRRNFLITKAIYFNSQGAADGILGVMLDITDRKQVENDLRRSEMRHRRLFDGAAMGIFQATVEGQPINLNPAMARMFGYPSPEAALATIRDLGTEFYADPAARLRNVEQILASDVPVRKEVLFRRRDGSVFIGDFHGWKVRDTDGRLLYLEGFIEDISTRKQAELRQRDSEERLRFLSARLLAAQETESRRIAMDIHDDMGQNLAVLKLQVQTVARRLRRDQPRLKEECRQALELIDQVIAKARQITRDLTPAVIEDLKLGGTLQWMAHDMGQRAGLQVELAMDDIDDLFPQDAQVIIYRIVQEALRNTIKHGRARRVTLRIERQARGVRCVIADDGWGFDPDTAALQQVTERGMGLAAMDERARMLGGALIIDSRPGRGTRVDLWIPTPISGEAS